MFKSELHSHVMIENQFHIFVHEFTTIDSKLSIAPNNVVYLEVIGSYLSSKFETIGRKYMNKGMEVVFNHDMSVKPRFEHLKELNLFKYHFYCKLDTEK